MLTIGRVAVASLALCAALAVSAPRTAGAQTRSRAEWIALRTTGFAVPAGQSAAALLLEMNPLLASTDPVLRDDVAFSAAEKWIVRDKVVAPDDLRRLVAQWSANLDDGLGGSGDDRVFKRSFSALSLSLIAAREVATPFLTADEAQRLFDRVLDYFQRERDLRGFDAERGWMHSVAHTADAFKFLARGTHWAPANLPRLLDAVRAKIGSHPAVFAWGENDRVALALHAAVRRPDADSSVVTTWLARWEDDHKALWATGPQIDPARFVPLENAKQVLRSLHAAFAMDRTPTTQGDAVRTAVLVALARMR